MLRLHETSWRSRRPMRSAGFSLVELLVSITIFVILATIALSAFRDSKHDKVAAASRQISASIGGARSRASRAVEPRGVRLLRDKLDYSLVSGLQYVGQSQLYNGTLVIEELSGNVFQLTCQQVGVWGGLWDEGLFSPGCQVYVKNYDPNFVPTPAKPSPSPVESSTGRWYTIRNVGFNPGGGIVQIVGEYDTTVPSFPVPYLLRTSPQVLPDAEPINLPPGIVIDLPSSIIPDSWKKYEDANQNGLLDGNEDDGSPTAPLNPYLPNPYDNGDGVLNNLNFDIPISPNGTVSGALSGAGPIYLYVCPREDVDRMRSMLSTANGGVYGSDYLPGKIPGDFENDYGPDHPSSERRVICIIPQTGLVYIANVNGADADKDGWADDPYSFARDGRETR